MGAATLPAEVRTYRQGYLTFTLSPQRTIIRTSLQTFFLLPRESYWYRKLLFVRTMIELGEIRDLNDLAAFCGTGIEWRATGATVEQLLYNERRYGRQADN